MIEKLVPLRLCELLQIYMVSDESRAKEATARMKALIDSLLIDEAME